MRARAARAGVHFRGVGGSTDVPARPGPARDHRRGLAARRRSASPSASRRSTRSWPTPTAPRRIVDAGVVPERVIETAEHYEPAMRGRASRPAGSGSASPGSTSCASRDGEFRVIEDNLMTPSGFAYAVAAREAVLPELDPAPGAAPRSFAELPALLAGTLRAAAPAHDEPYLVVLTDGPDNSAHWEHAWAASGARRAARRARRPAAGRRPAAPRRARRRRASTGARTPTCSTPTPAGCSARPCGRGRVGDRQRVRLRRRRRQAHARVRRGHGALLPRRGAAPALGPDARPGAPRRTSSARSTRSPTW